jgi:signal transduction histidine kinase
LTQTDLDKCLDALFEKDRLSHIGKLIRGLIHNVNGPLQNVSMLVEMLIKAQQQSENLIEALPEDMGAQWSKLQEKQQQRLGRLLEQVSSLAEMLRDFMLVHEIERSGSEADINLLLTNLVRVFHADLFFKHYVSCELRLTDNLPLVRVPGRDLVPALEHLFENAITAMRNSPNKHLVIETLRRTGSVQIVFRDTGCGPDPDAAPGALFGLFYSAWPKSGEPSEGNPEYLGFGLYAARSLLEPYGGDVRLERDGEETLAVLDIPVSF